jgi:UDP-2-acetamido-3-amino-2,3-dideoxy-glucuronate N-acetyltransferase
MKPFIHEQALCESPHIGEGTRIWAFAHILPGARIGDDCNICDHVFIENDVVVGHRVTVKCGVQLWDGLRLQDGVFVGPNVTFTNDPFPRSRKKPAQFAVTTVGTGASIGANATILPGIHIGQGAMIGAGSVVTRNVPEHAIVVGNPARITDYVEARDSAGAPNKPAAPAGTDATASASNGNALKQLTRVDDMRGALTAIEFARDLPFIPKRSFMVYAVPSSEIRGEHAHRICHQFLVCVHGSVSVLVDDGSTRHALLLDQPHVGLHIPPMVWATQYRYSADAVLLVFASEAYDAADYIRDYAEFVRIVHDGT